MKKLGLSSCTGLTFLVAVSFVSDVHAAKPDASSRNLPVRYEELSAPEFVKAVARSAGVCLIPAGIIEKHGPHLPLATDLLTSRELALRAAAREYALVFPWYYFGQIHEAKHQPGTLAYSPDLVWKMLQETCDELSRNGLKKIILVNGHGGNNAFLQYFCQSQLASPKDYVLILFRPEDNPALESKIKSLRKTSTGGHADEMETSEMLVVRPDLVHAERGKDQSGKDRKRLEHLPYTYTGIWWYAKYPNHYAGDGSSASRELGELLINSHAEQLVKLIQAVKKDGTVRELQRLFFEQSSKPLKTRQ